MHKSWILDSYMLFLHTSHSYVHAIDVLQLQTLCACSPHLPVTSAQVMRSEHVLHSEMTFARLLKEDVITDCSYIHSSLDNQYLHVST